MDIKYSFIILKIGNIVSDKPNRCMHVLRCVGFEVLTARTVKSDVMNNP